MERERLTEQEAFSRLRRASQISGRPMRVVAEALIATFESCSRKARAPCGSGRSATGHARSRSCSHCLLHGRCRDARRRATLSRLAPQPAVRPGRLLLSARPVGISYRHAVELGGRLHDVPGAERFPCIARASLRELRGANGNRGVAGRTRARAGRARPLLSLRRDPVVEVSSPTDRRPSCRPWPRRVPPRTSRRDDRASPHRGRRGARGEALPLRLRSSRDESGPAPEVGMLRARTVDRDIRQLSIDTIRTLAMDAVQQANAGPSRYRDGPRTAFLRSLHEIPTDESGQPEVAGARPVRAFSRPRLRASVRDPAPDGLRALARRAQGLSSVGLANARASGSRSHTGGGNDHGTARPGVCATRSAWRSRSASCRSATTGRATRSSITMSTPIASDGDLMEGVCQEAASIAGQFGLGKLIVCYDDNRITIDGPTALSFDGENQEKRFRAYGWHVQQVDDVNDLTALELALQTARDERERPSLISIRSHIAYPAPRAQDTAKGARCAARRGGGQAHEGGARLGSRAPLPRSGRGLRAHGPAATRGRALEEEWREPLRSLERRLPRASP